MKIIPVTRCTNCPYFADFHCKRAPMKDGEFYKYVPSVFRERGIIPDWCPLIGSSDEQIYRQIKQERKGGVKARFDSYEEGN